MKIAVLGKNLKFLGRCVKSNYVKNLHSKGESNILTVLRRISQGKASFVTRGDNSGTHIRELSLWEHIQIVPEGKWYIESKQSMLASLKLASDLNAYTLSDRSTYLYNQKALGIEILVKGDRRLRNYYSVIAVNPEKVPGINFAAAMAFVDFVISHEGQGIICNFGVEKLGVRLFTPSLRPL